RHDAHARARTARPARAARAAARASTATRTPSRQCRAVGSWRGRLPHARAGGEPAALLAQPGEAQQRRVERLVGGELEAVDARLGERLAQCRLAGPGEAGVACPERP